MKNTMTKFNRFFYYSVRTILALGFIASAWPAVTLAQSPLTPLAPLMAQGVPHADTVPYVIVVFCLILGFIIVCRTANRSAESRLDDLEEL
jgi:hypothetical protein